MSVFRGGKTVFGGSVWDHRIEGKPTEAELVRSWLPDMDLNHDKQIQSLLCYRYTIGQSIGRLR